MTKTQKLICYSLIFSGIFFLPILRLLTADRSYALVWVGFALLAGGWLYGGFVLWQAKRYHTFKRLGLRFGVMAITLLALYLVWG